MADTDDEGFEPAETVKTVKTVNVRTPKKANAINTKGGKRREARRNKRRETRQNRKTERREKREERRDERAEKRQEYRDLQAEGPEKQYFGGSREDIIRRRQETQAAVNEARTNLRSSVEGLGNVAGRADELERGAGEDYNTAIGQSQQSRAQQNAAISGINQSAQAGSAMRNAALNQNQLTKSADSVLAQREAYLAGKPTIGQATDTALAAQGAAAQQRLQQQVGLQNRAAMGLASGQGEGGALAMQQAMATAGQGAADQALANQTQQNELGATMRFNAAQMQNQQDVAAADLGANYRMGAAEKERTAQLGFADTSAQEGLYAAGQTATQTGAMRGQDAAAAQAATVRQANLLGQRSSAYGTVADAAIADKGQEYQADTARESLQFGYNTEDERARWEEEMKAKKPKGLKLFNPKEWG